MNANSTHVSTEYSQLKTANRRSPIGVAVVGIGYWGPNLLRALSRVEGARILACADLNADRRAWAAREYPDIRIVADYHVLLADPQIQAVVIATPAGTHYAIASDVLIAGKHLLVEKPICNSVEQGRALCALARAKQRVLMVDHIFIYNPAVQKLAEIMRSGQLGDVCYIQATRTSLGPRLCEDANIVWDAQIHELYILPFCLGRLPERVIATGAAFVRPGIEDVVFTTLFFPGRTIAHCHNTSYAPLKTRKMIVVGSEKMAVYDDMNEATRLSIYKRGYAPYNGVDSLGNRGLKLYDDGVETPEILWQEPLLVEITHFVDCVLNGTKPITDGDSAVQVLELTQAVDRSLKSGGEVVLL